MSTAPGAGHPPVAKRTSRPLRSNRRLWTITALVLFAVPAFYTILFTMYWPFKKQALIDVLQERSRRSVTIDQFRTTYFPPGGVAEGIKFWRYKHKNEPPLITIQKITISVTVPTLLTFQHRLDTLHVIGLHLTVPAQEPAGDPSPMLLLTSSTSKSSLPVAHLEASNAVLDYFVHSNPQPVRVTVNELRAQHVSSTTSIGYSIQLSNSEVPGSIESEGTFGPLNLKQTGNTPVRGHFSYKNGNLTPVQAVAGTLFANGNYSGSLADIAVRGTAQVQNFTVRGSSHSRNVSADYQLAVNAINGDVGLKNISATFDNSAIVSTGVISARAPKGDLASLGLTSQHARVQDLLDLFISSKQAPLTGDVSLTAHFDLPATYKSFIRDMTLRGSFGIAKGKFTNQSTEGGLTKLSQTSNAGKREESQENPSAVLSDLTGQATVTQGVAHLEHVEFRIPGAKALLSGTYNLLTYQTNLKGTLITTGNVSDTETGIKSLFLKALTPFFKHHRKAKVIPFKITGPYGHTTVSLDLGRTERKISS
jgi:hypothetical protein